MRARESDLKIYSGSSLAVPLLSMKQDMLDFGDSVDVGEWQGRQDRLEANATWELRNVIVDVPIPPTVEAWIDCCDPNLPWAEEHFQERVSGEPLNPPPSHVRWPYAGKDNEEHMPGGKFSHTYPERFWPRFAGDRSAMSYEEREQRRAAHYPNTGIRFTYGDLADLVLMLGNRPGTRQAYLPIWFPEDLTAARQGQRVPCTLGYHFMIRNHELSCTYFMRSCDLIRHFQDDAYMAGRLTQWICDELAPHAQGEPHRIFPGDLTMHVASMHIFPVDMHNLRRESGLRT